ncbi:MAG: glycine cleavage T C-terminal barrel domain-containing protein, partial [Eubacteriales bacterium]|nr:glycine cleavage T C-terminal barrel domain-containing protein [Eubacteriales bacterium]
DYEWIQRCILDLNKGLNPKRNDANLKGRDQEDRSELKIKAEAVNVSDSCSQIAIQGPMAEAILQSAVPDVCLSEIGFFRFINNVAICTDKEGSDRTEALISRTGYTGEDGFEIYLAPENAPELWRRLLEAGRGKGLIPAGLGARDTLRFEAALPLYGCEISESITPLEAGLGMFVKFNKEDFIGRGALIRQKEDGLSRRLAGVEMTDKGVPRGHYEVKADGRKIGHVTTGNFSPSLNSFLGIVLIESRYAEEGNNVDVVIRGRDLKAKVVKLPFYSKRYKKVQ